MFNEGWKERPLTTAGPFKLGAIDLTAKTMTLVRNEKWWGDRAKLDRIVFRAIDPTRRSTRWPTARSTPWTSGRTPTSTPGRKASRSARSASPAGRTSGT